MKLNNRKNIRAFTLIELSIVLVILAVIVGGILTGQSLIKTAELNGFVSELEATRTSFQRFQAKYAQLPGDMDNAYDIWGSDCSATQAFCDGDGDAIADAQMDLEGVGFWRHLVLSEMVDYYVAVAEDPEEDCILGANLPHLSMDGVGMMPYDPRHVIDSRTATVSSYQQALIYGVPNGDPEVCASDGSGYFTAEQLYTIDKKMDDGFAYSGKILNSENVSGCSTSTNAGAGDLDDGDYDLANNGINLCHLYFRVKVD